VPDDDFTRLVSAFGPAHTRTTCQRLTSDISLSPASHTAGAIPAPCHTLLPVQLGRLTLRRREKHDHVDIGRKDKAAMPADPDRPPMRSAK
jgi:hypothetical protein